MYEAMEGDPVTIRFLDPPLHEFVPTEEEDIAELADDMGIDRGGASRPSSPPCMSSTP